METITHKGKIIEVVQKEVEQNGIISARAPSPTDDCIRNLVIQKSEAHTPYPSNAILPS